MNHWLMSVEKGSESRQSYTHLAVSNINGELSLVMVKWVDGF